MTKRNFQAKEYAAECIAQLEEDKSARGWLTEEERRDLWEIASLLEDSGWQKCADALLAILARLTPKVKEASND